MYIIIILVYTYVCMCTIVLEWLASLPIGEGHNYDPSTIHDDYIIALLTYFPLGPLTLQKGHNYDSNIDEIRIDYIRNKLQSVLQVCSGLYIVYKYTAIYMCISVIHTLIHIALSYKCACNRRQSITAPSLSYPSCRLTVPSRWPWSWQDSTSMKR